jgi:hypothetical protein
MNPLRRMQQAVSEEKYRVSSHANEEMAEDSFLIADIEHIINTGKIVQKQTQDPRGRRYVILGHTADNRQGYVVGRFLLSGELLIITAYAA